MPWHSSSLLGTFGNYRCNSPHPPCGQGLWLTGYGPTSGSASPAPWKAALCSGCRSWNRRPQGQCHLAPPFSATGSEGPCWRVRRCMWVQPTSHALRSCSPLTLLLLRKTEVLFNGKWKTISSQAFLKVHWMCNGSKFPNRFYLEAPPPHLSVLDKTFRLRKPYHS